jgi:hypothetical protein
MEQNAQKPEFIVQDGAIRLLQVKVSSGEGSAFFLDRNDSQLKKLVGKGALVEDFPQEEYRAAEGLTSDMLTYLPGEEKIDFDTCIPECLEGIIQKWCMRKNVPPIDPMQETLLKDEMIRAFGSACRDAIEEGVEVDTSEGVKKFSLTLQDQINLMTARHQLDAGSLAIPYHADGEPMRLWSEKDMRRIIEESERHVLYHRMYFNQLREWVLRTDYPDWLRMEYESDLSDDMAESMQTMLASLEKPEKRRE